MVSDLFNAKPIPWSKWFTGVFVLVGLFAMLAIRHEEDAHPSRYALPISAPFDRGAYQYPDGCLPRTWSVDEYLPAACVRGHGFYGPNADLQRTRTGGRRSGFLKPRALAWVRVNADAVLIARAIPDMGGMIVQVERNRFRPTRLQTLDIPADPPPLSYWFFYAMAFVMHGGLIALMAGALWWRRPWQTPPEQPAAEPLVA
jgi:hypothetical protein